MGKLDDELRLKELQGKENLMSDYSRKLGSTLSDAYKSYRSNPDVPLNYLLKGDLPGTAKTMARGAGQSLQRLSSNPEEIMNYATPLGGAAGVVKNVGGQWEKGAADRLMRELRDRYHNSDIDNWLQTVGRKYIMNRSGTPADEIMHLADKGVLHISPKEIRRGFEQDDRLLQHDIVKTRKNAGYPGVGQAETDLGRRWELRADAMIEPFKASDLSRSSSARAEMPWLEKVDPETPVYGHLISDVPEHLGFDKLTAALRQEIMEGRLRPEQLNKVSMADAVTLAHNQRLAREATEKKALAALPRSREYPGTGMSWQELTHENPETLHDILKNEGDVMQNCIKGYCTDVLEDGTKLYSLRDAKGNPHVNIEVRPKQVKYSDIVNHIGEEKADELLKNFSAREVINMYPELRPLGIKQIKGKQNAAPVEQYLPYVQDFVRNPMHGKDFAEVGDFHNTGLLDVDRLKEHGLLNDTQSATGRKIHSELDRIFPSEVNQWGGTVLSGDKGTRIPSYDMMTESVKDLGGKYITPEELHAHLQTQEPRPVEHSYSKYWDEQKIHPELLQAIENGEI